MPEFNAKQTAALNTFKEALADVRKADWDDSYYARWLTARGWDVKKAEKMLRDDVEWRKKNDVDNVLSVEHREVLKNYYPGGFFGEDKDGFPTWIDVYSTMDLKPMFYSATKQEMKTFLLAKAEHLFKNIFPELSKKSGKKIDKCNIIMDLEGMGKKHLWKPAMTVRTELLQTLEAHYPDTLHKAYIVNAPKLFPVAYSIAKPFLNEYTRTKVQVIGGDFKPHLLKHFDADQLPKHWGGTATGPDGNEFGSPQIIMGSKIPDKYKIDNFMDNVDMSQFVTVTIQRGSSLQLDFEITEPNSIISWQFKSEGNDVGFGLYRRTGEGRQKAGEMEEVVKTERVNSHMVPENGQHPCTETGTYVLRFDNTYSWVNAKKLQYLVEIHNPDLAEKDELQHVDTKL